MLCLPFRACERVRDFPSWGTVWLKRKLLKLAAQLKPKRFFQSVLHSSLPEKSLILAETLGSKGGLHVWTYNWNPTCNRFLRNLLLGAISCRGTHQPTEPPPPGFRPRAGGQGCAGGNLVRPRAKRPRSKRLGLRVLRCLCVCVCLCFLGYDLLLDQR